MLLHFFCFFGICIKFQMFWKKYWTSYVKYFLSYWLKNMDSFKSMRGLVSENPLAVNMWTSPKNNWSRQKSTFILLFHHSERNWVRKSSFESDLRFSDCLLIRWLATLSILVVIERIYRYQFKSSYLENHKFFADFVLYFLNLH